MEYAQWLTITGGIMSLIFGSAIIFKKESKKKFKWIKPVGLILGGVITLFGGYLSNRKSELDGRIIKSKVDSNQLMNNRNIILTNKVEQLTLRNNELISINLKLSKSNNGLAQKNLEFINRTNKITQSTNEYMRGTNSYCIIGLFFFIVGNLETACLTLYNPGPNPLKNIYVRIIKNNRQLGGKNFFEDFGNHFKIDILYPNREENLENMVLTLDTNKISHISYIITTNGGWFRQDSYYKFNKKKRNWNTIDTLYNSQTNELITVRQ